MTWAPSSDTSTDISTRSPTNTCWSSSGVTIRTGGSVGYRGAGGQEFQEPPPEPHTLSSGPGLSLAFDKELSETLLIFDRDLISSIIRQCALVDGENSLLTNVLKHVPGAKILCQPRAWRRSQPWGRSAQARSQGASSQGKSLPLRARLCGKRQLIRSLVCMYVFLRERKRVKVSKGREKERIP